MQTLNIGSHLDQSMHLMKITSLICKMLFNVLTPQRNKCTSYNNCKTDPFIFTKNQKAGSMDLNLLLHSSSLSSSIVGLPF